MRSFSATALSAAILLASGLAIAQTIPSTGSATDTTSGTTPTHSGTTPTQPSTGTTGTTATTGTTTQPSTSGSAAAGATSGATTMATEELSEMWVEMALTAAGYTDVSEIEIDGDKFTAKATKDGTDYDIEGTKSERKAEQAQVASEDEIRAELEKQDYQNVSNIEQSGSTASAEATKDGDDVMLHMDTASGLMWQAKESS